MDEIDNLLDEAADEVLRDTTLSIPNSDKSDQDLDDTLRFNVESLAKSRGLNMTDLLHDFGKLNGKNGFSVVEDEDISKINEDILKILHQLLTTQKGDPQDIVKNLLLRVCSQEGIDLDDEIDESEVDLTCNVEEDDKRILLSREASQRSVTACFGDNFGETDDDTEIRDGTEAMHRAVFQGSYALVSELLEQNQIEYYDVRDRHGNTPLLLAIKLRDIDMAVTLINRGASCDINAAEGPGAHLLDEAIGTRDRRLVRLVYSKLQEGVWNHWLARRSKLLTALLKIPDFFIELDWRFYSHSLLGPLVKAVAPHDTYSIWKRGNWLRIDSSIVGFTKPFGVKRGNISLLFTGSGSAQPGDLLIVDRVKKTVSRAFRKLESPTVKELDLMAQKLLAAANTKQGKEFVDLDVGNFKFSPLLDEETGATRTEVTDSWSHPCHIWQAEVDIKVLAEKKDVYMTPIDTSRGREVAALEYFSSERMIALDSRPSTPGSSNFSSEHTPSSQSASRAKRRASAPGSVLSPRSEESAFFPAFSAASESTLSGLSRDRGLENSPKTSASILKSFFGSRTKQEEGRGATHLGAEGSGPLNLGSPVNNSDFDDVNRIQAVGSSEDPQEDSRPNSSRMHPWKSRKVAPRVMLDRHVKAAVWMQPDCPFRLKDLLPALEVLAMKDKYIKKLNEVLDSVLRDVPGGYFPVKIRIPLFLGINARFSFGHIVVEEPVSMSHTISEVFDPMDPNLVASDCGFCALFEIPADYVNVESTGDTLF